MRSLAMLLLLVVTILVEVVFTITSSPSFASGLSNVRFEDIVTRVQVAILVYLVLDSVFICHAPVFDSPFQYALSAIVKTWTGTTRVLSPKLMFYTGLYVIKALRVVVRLLAALVFPLLEPSLLLAHGVSFALLHLAWDFIRRGAAACILFALSALIRLIRSIGMYGYAALTSLWKRRLLLLSMSLVLLDRLCEAWSAPPGAFVFTAVDEESDGQGEPIPPARALDAREDRTTNVMLPPKEILSRREALSSPLGCTDPLTVTSNKANVEPNEREQTAAATSTTNDNKSIPESKQSEAAPRRSDALAPCSSLDSNSSIPSSAIDTTLDQSTTTLDTALDLSLSSPSTELTPISTGTSLVDAQPECLAVQGLETSEPRLVIDAQPIVDSPPPADAPTPPAPIMEHKLAHSTPKQESTTPSKPQAKPPAPAPRKFKLPAKFSLSMSCELFKAGAAPQPKSLPDLPVWLPCNHDVPPLREQLEKLTICAPDPEETDNEVHPEFKTAKSGAETRPYNTGSTGLLAEDATVGLGNSEQATERTETLGINITVENVAGAATDSLQAMAGTAISHTGTPAASLLDDPLDSPLPDGTRTPSPSPANSGVTTPDAESDASSPSYFDKGKWPEVDVNEARRELALAGAPMMSTTPGTSRTSTVSPVAEVVPSLDEETQRLSAQCDELGYIADEEWTDGSEDGSSASSPGSESDSSIADSPRPDTAQTPSLPDPALNTSKMEAKKTSQGTKRARSDDEEEGRVSKRRPQHRDELEWPLAN